MKGRSDVDQILIGKGAQPVYLLAKYGNRHGLVAGATGTGKTTSLLVMAEGFSRLGVPVFMADVKGDVASLAAAGAANDKIKERIAQIGIQDWTPEASPHQRRGIGIRIVQALTEHVEGVPFKNTWVGIFAVEGTAEFYARFGYKAQRPSGPAMSRSLNPSRV